ncbi:MAG TPA: hypothetical protein VFP58_07555 [Candidatus Eisenbacteria bacterium]|nr:hypothetical protein [Candidatus Eisenbacteria bacterium]
MSWARRLLGVDRRIIFIFIGLGTAVPLLLPVNLPITVTPRVEAAYQTIDTLPEGSRVLISMDYEPDTMAELQPMSIAIMRHCFRKNLKVIGMTLYPAGPGLVEPAMRIAAEAEGKTRNVDYVFLGYKSGFQTVMIGLGESLRQQYPVDFYRTPLDSIPVLRGVDSYAQIDLVVNLTASSAADYWIQFAATRYRKKLVLGATAVMATDYYPYLSSRQLLGLVGGMKGAAEYEKRMDLFGDARRGMDAQSLVHVIIAILVILGNVALLAMQRSGEGGGPAGPLGGPR